MDENKLKQILKSTVIVFIILLIVYLYIERGRILNHIPKSEITYQEKLEMEIEELKEENNKYQEKISELNSSIDYLQEEYEHDEDLIGLLRDQLLSYGIEPYDL